MDLLKKWHWKRAVTATRKLYADIRLFHRRVKGVVIAMNSLFYSLFVIFVLLFQFLAKIPKPICGERVTTDLDNAKETQRVTKEKVKINFL